MIRIKQQQKQKTDSKDDIDKKSVFVSTIKIIFLIGAGYIFFHKLWEEIISNCIVDKILCYVEDNVVNQVIFVVAVIVFFVLTIIEIKDKKRRSDCAVVASFLVIGMWVYYRFCSSWSDVWSYVSLGNSCIYYIDIFPVVAGCVIFNRFWFMLHNSTRKINENMGFSQDLPITKESQDVLGRNGLAERLADEIYNTKTEDGSFSVGIVSPWGNGKTSFISLVHDHLKKHKEIIWMEFNPWKYEKNVSLVEAFFIQLAKNVRPYNDLLAINLLDYAHVLTSSSNPLIALTSKIKEGHTNIEQKFLIISRAIKKIGKQIIVVIDDLDRLDGDEILSVLKLIRNIANFPNMVFISAYDRKYLVKSLECNKICKSNIYLEKIFQHEMYLPVINQEAIIRLIEEEGKKVIIGENDLKEFEDIVQNVRKREGESLYKILNTSPGFCYNLLSNLRDVHRLMNAFGLIYTKLQGNIIIQDLMNLELLKLKYPDIYNLFATNYELYLTISQDHYVLWDESKDNKEQIFKQKHQDIREVIKNEYNDEDREKIIMILMSMFKESMYGKAYRSIRYPYTINRYFCYSLLETEISQDEFEKTMDQPYEEVKMKIDEWNVDKPLSLALCLINYDFQKDQDKSKERYKKLLRSIFYLGKISEKYYIGISEINSIIQRSPIKNQEEHKKFILQVFEENGLSRFVVIYIQKIMEEKKIDWDFIVPKQDCLEVCYLMFKKACEEKQDPETIYNFFNDTKEIVYVRKEGGVLERKEKLNKKAVDLFNDYALKNPEEVFPGYIAPATIFKNNKEYKMGDLLYRTVWENNRENFNAYVSGLPEDNEVIKEFKDFYKAYQENNYQPIPYEFKFIKLNY